MNDFSYLQLKEIKDSLVKVREECKTIHVTINNRRNKVKEAPSKIIGIYERFLCVESMVNNYSEKFTINYIDLITQNILIKELKFENNS